MDICHRHFEAFVAHLGFDPSYRRLEFQLLARGQAVRCSTRHAVGGVMLLEGERDVTEVSRSLWGGLNGNGR